MDDTDEPGGIARGAGAARTDTRRWTGLESYVCQAAGKVLPQFVSLVTQGLFAQYAGVDSFGRFFLLGVIWSSTFAVFAGGTDNYFQKLHRQELVFSALLYKVAMGVLVCVLITPVLLMLHYTMAECLVFNGALTTMALVEVQLVFFRVANRDRCVVYQKATQIVTLLVLLVWCKPGTLLGYGAVLWGSWFLPLVASTLNVLVVWRRAVDPLCFFTRSHSRRVVLLGLSIMASQIYGNADFVMLERLEGSVVAGSYKVAVLLASAVLPILQGVNLVFLSRAILTLQARDWAGFQNVIRRQVLVVGGAMVAFFGFAVVAFPLILRFLFERVDPVFVRHAWWLIGGSTLIVVSWIFSGVLLALGQERVIASATTALAAVSLGIAYVFVRWGASYGAVLANVCINGLLCGVYAIAVRHLWRRPAAWLEACAESGSPK